MPELPCPAYALRRHHRWVNGRLSNSRRALFLLGSTGSLSGAVFEGKILPATDAQALFLAQPWQPSIPGQHWPSRDTEHLASVPGMTSSIVNGLATPLSDCSPDPGW